MAYMPMAQRAYSRTQTFSSSNYWVDVVFSSGPAPTLNSIAVTPANPTIQAGATQQFTATGTYSDSSTQNITNQVTWASATTTVATINASGLASGVAAGTSNISATQGTVSGSTVLTVQPAAPAPLAITTNSPLPGGTVGVAYSATLARSGGTPPYTWSITAGCCPAGLTLTASTGSIAGTPTTAGTFTFTVQVDGFGHSYTASKLEHYHCRRDCEHGFLGADYPNAPVTSNAGDNNGFETNPTNAFASDGLFAVDANSGTSTGTDAPSTARTNIVLQLRSSTSAADRCNDSGHRSPLRRAGQQHDERPEDVCSALLEWWHILDYGAEYSHVKHDHCNVHVRRCGQSLGAHFLDIDRAQQREFRVRITNVASSTARTFSLDGVAVRVTYQ